MSSDTDPASSIFVNNQSTLNVKGNLSGTNTYLSTENSKVNVNKDLKLDGKTETIFGSFNGSDIKVDGNASVADLVRFTADRDSSIEIGKDLNLNSTLSDTSDSYRESVGIYNNSHMTVGGDVNVLGDSLIKSDGDASIEIGGDLNVKVDSHRNEIVGIYNNGSIKVNGNLTADRDSKYVEAADINVGTNSKLDVSGNAKLTGNTHLGIWGASEANIGGNLDVSGSTADGSIIYNRVEDHSSLTVAGNVNISGTSNIAALNNATINFEKDLNVESKAKRDLFCVGENSVGNIKGDMKVTGTTEDGHQNYYDMRNSGTLNVAGNVSFEGTNNLHVFDKSELNVGKNATFNEGEFSVTDSSNAKIEGDLTVEDNAKINIYDKSSLNVGGALSATDSKVSIDGISTLKVGGDASIVTNTDNTDWSSISNNATLDVAGNLTVDKTNMGINNSTVKVGKDLNLNFSADTTTDTLKSHMAYVEGSNISVDGNLNMNGQYVAGTNDNLDNDDDWNAFYKNRLVVSKGGSSLDVKGDVNLKDNSHVKVESYWGEWGENASTEIPEFDKVTTAHIGGNVTLDNNSYLDSGHSAELTVDGNVTIKNGSQFGSWLANDKATIVKGNVKVTDANSKINTGNRAKIDIGGNLEVSDGGLADAWSQGNIKVAGNASFDSGMLKSEKNSKVTVGNDLSLTNSLATLADNGVLNVAGNLKAKGSYIDAKNTSLSVGNNLNADNSSLQIKDSTLTVNGNYEGVNTYLNANGKSAVTVDKDLLVSGKIETITGAFDGASLKVGGSATVSDLVRFSADRDAAIEIGQDLNLNSTLSDASYSTRESAGIYNKSTMKVGGDVNVLSDSLLKADFDSSIEIDGDMNVKVDSHRNEIVGAYNNSSIKVKGSLNADRSSTFKENADINSGINSTLEIAGNAKLTGNSKFNIFDKSKINVGGSLEFSRDAGNDVWTNLSSNSSLNVEGDLTSDKSSLSAYENSSRIARLTSV